MSYHPIAEIVCSVLKNDQTEEIIKLKKQLTAWENSPDEYPQYYCNGCEKIFDANYDYGEYLRSVEQSMTPDEKNKYVERTCNKIPEFLDIKYPRDQQKCLSNVGPSFWLNNKYDETACDGCGMHYCAPCAVKVNGFYCLNCNKQFCCQTPGARHQPEEIPHYPCYICKECFQKTDICDSCGKTMQAIK